MSEDGKTNGAGRPHAPFRPAPAGAAEGAEEATGEEGEGHPASAAGDPAAPGEGGGEGEGEEAELPDEPAEPMPAAIGELAAACVRFVATKYGVPLDFTQDTLSVLDHYVRDARAEIIAKPASLPLLQATIGAYLGEVIRRAHRGLWECEGEHETWKVIFTSVYLAFNPIGMAREALLEEAQPGWNAHFDVDDAEREGLEQRLASLGEVPEDEYYAPTTRFDAVEVAIDHLAARMRAQGLGDVRFDRSDYE